jgi:hypothetical protein
MYESPIAGMLRMLFMLVTVMTTMAIGCAWSFLGEEGQVASEEATVVAVAEVAIEVAEAGDPQQDGRSTEFS